MSPPGGVPGPRTSLSLLQAAIARTAPMAATRLRLFSRNILMSPGGEVEVGLEAERVDVRVQRVEAAVEGDRLRVGRTGSALVDTTATALGEDVGIGGVEHDTTAHDGDAAAEHAEGAILLGQERGHRLLRRGGRVGREAG